MSFVKLGHDGAMSTARFYNAPTPRWLSQRRLASEAAQAILLALPWHRAAKVGANRLPGHGRCSRHRDRRLTACESPTAPTARPLSDFSLFFLVFFSFLFFVYRSDFGFTHCRSSLGAGML